MKRLSLLQIILSSSLTLALILLGQAFLSNYKQSMIDEIMTDNVDRINTSYQVVLETFQIAAKKDFFHITHNPKVIAYLTEFKEANIQRQAELRGLLYRELISNYRVMKALGVRQFHFHTHRGESLLRFHYPSKNGDNLSEIRPSIRIANTQFQEVVGFEGGRIFPGFRYVFPVINNHQHLGSVEFSVSFEAIEQKLRTIFSSIGTQLVMNAANSHQLTFDSIKDYFKGVPYHADYYVETPKLSEINRSIASSTVIERINEQLTENSRVQKQMDEHTAFYLPFLIDSECYMVTFVPFNNILGEHAGFITVYQNFKQMAQIQQTTFSLQVILFIVAISFWVLFNIIWSQQKRSLELNRRLLQKNSMMEEAQAVAHFGSWELSVPKNKVVWSREARNILGLKDQSTFNFEDFFACVPKEEREKVRTAYQESINQRKPYLYQHQMVSRENGSMYVVEAHAHHRFDEHGNHIATVGTLYDMTKNAKAFERLKKIIDLQKSIALLTDGESFDFANQSFLTFFGYRSIDGFKKNYRCICERFIDDASFFSLKKVKPNEAHWIESLLNLSERERVVIMNDFLERPRAFSVSISEFDHGFYMVFFTDITDTMKEKVQMQNQLNKDELTQVYNRHFLTNNADNIVETIAHHHKQSVFLYFLDIDHFKRINDHYGHAIGDQVLVNFARIVSSILREDDFLIRLGGEEFLIIQGSPSLESAEHKAQQILTAVNSHLFEKVGQLTCSIGVTQLNEGEMLNQAIVRADENMYQAKQAGRNQVVIQ